MQIGFNNCRMFFRCMNGGVWWMQTRSWRMQQCLSMHAYAVFVNEGLHYTVTQHAAWNWYIWCYACNPSLWNPFQLHLRYSSSWLRDFHYVVDSHIARLHFVVSSWTRWLPRLPRTRFLLNHSSCCVLPLQAFASQDWAKKLTESTWLRSMLPW